MKSYSLAITSVFISTLIYSSLFAQDSSFVGIIIDSTNAPLIKIFDVPIKNMKIYGSEKAINELLNKPSILDCNSLLSKRTCKDFKKITDNDLVKSNEISKPLKIEMQNPNEFVNILKKKLGTKSKPRPMEEKMKENEIEECDVVSNICIGNKEASFNIGCENGFTMEISTSGTIKLTAERNGVSAGVTLIK